MKTAIIIPTVPGNGHTLIRCVESIYKSLGFRDDYTIIVDINNFEGYVPATNRAIKRATRQDARLDKAINRINNRGNSPMETLPAANTRIPQPIYPGMSEMDRMPTRPMSDIPMSEMMGGGSVTKAKAYRNNTRGKARKNR